MSDTAKEINKVTGAIIRISCKMIFYALVFFILYEGITAGYRFGYEIFNSTAVATAPGVDKEVTIPEGASASDVGKMLEDKGLIKNRLIFVIQQKIFEYDLTPGNYTLNTSMTSRDMLQLLDEAQEDLGDDSK